MRYIHSKRHDVIGLLAAVLLSSGTVHAGTVGAQRPAASARSTESVGTARMERDGTIVVDLVSVGDGGMIAEGQFRYPPADRNYAMVARHVGRIPEGGTVNVRPFPSSDAQGPSPASSRRADGTCTAKTVGHGSPLGRWTGSCAGGLADGFGAMRMRVTSGPRVSGGDGVFAGFAEHGRPISGIVMMDDGMLSPLSPTTGRTPPGIDEQGEAFELAYDNSLAGAKAAARAHRRSGNMASAGYYVRLHQRLLDGRLE